MCSDNQDIIEGKEICSLNLYIVMNCFNKALPMVLIFLSYCSHVITAFMAKNFDAFLLVKIDKIILHMKNIFDSSSQLMTVKTNLYLVKFCCCTLLKNQIYCLCRFNLINCHLRDWQKGKQLYKDLLKF